MQKINRIKTILFFFMVNYFGNDFCKLFEKCQKVVLYRCYRYLCGFQSKLRRHGWTAYYLRQFADEIVSVSFFRCFDHLFLRDAVISVSYILSDGSIKENGLLAYDTDVRSHPTDVQLRYINSIQMYLQKFHNHAKKKSEL